MSQKTTKDLSIALKVEKLSKTLDNAIEALNEFKTLAEGSEEIREWAQNEITHYAMSIKTSKIDKDELENFFKYPYVITSGKHDGEYYLSIPKFGSVTSSVVIIGVTARLECQILLMHLHQKILNCSFLNKKDNVLINTLKNYKENFQRRLYRT